MGMYIMPSAIAFTLLGVTFGIVALATVRWSSYDVTVAATTNVARVHAGLFRVCNADDVCDDITGAAMTDALKASIGTMLVSVIVGLLACLVLSTHCVLKVLHKTDKVFYLPIITTIGTALACIFSVVAVLVYDFEVHRSITSASSTSASRGHSFWFGVSSAAVHGVAILLCLLEQLVGQVREPKDEKPKSKKSRRHWEHQKQPPYMIYPNKAYHPNGY